MKDGVRALHQPPAQGRGQWPAPCGPSSTATWRPATPAAASPGVNFATLRLNTDAFRSEIAAAAQRVRRRRGHRPRDHPCRIRLQPERAVARGRAGPDAADAGAPRAASASAMPSTPRRTSAAACSTSPGCSSASTATCPRRRRLQRGRGRGGQVQAACRRTARPSATCNASALLADRYRATPACAEPAGAPVPRTARFERLPIVGCSPFRYTSPSLSAARRASAPARWRHVEFSFCGVPDGQRRGP